ncbi:MAG: FecR domain-containing protein [Pseudomonadota bacterium]
MSQERFVQKSSDVSAEACAWIAQLETGRMSEQDMTALKEWMKRSPRHYEEIRKAAYLSQETNILTDFAAPLQVAAQDVKQKAAPLGPSQKRGFGKYAVVALSFVFICIAALIGFQQVKPYAAEPFIVTTPVGGFESHVLSDGSTLKLNTDSQIEVDFSKDMRRIRLLKGEAFFEVAHNADRPFVVYAGDKYVKAVGTAFAVRWTDGDLSVTVSEGRVAFAPIETAQPVSVDTENPLSETSDIAPQIAFTPPVYLDQGDKLSLPKTAPDQLTQKIDPRALVRELSWQQGLLDFDQRPLVEVIEEINRYTTVKIEIMDPELSQREFGGIFRTGETDALLEALELSFDVQVEKLNDQHIRIHTSDANMSL